MDIKSDITAQKGDLKLKSDDSQEVNKEARKIKIMKEINQNIKDSSKENIEILSNIQDLIAEGIDIKI